MASAQKFDAKEIIGYDDKDSYWIAGGAFLGPIFSLNANDELAFDLRPQGGYVYASTPTVNDDDGNEVIEDYQAGSFGFNIGATGRYKVSDKLALSLNLDYLTAKTIFKPDQGDEWDEPISTLGITFGLNIGF